MVNRFICTKDRVDPYARFETTRHGVIVPFQSSVPPYFSYLSALILTLLTFLIERIRNVSTRLCFVRPPWAEWAHIGQCVLLLRSQS